MRRAAQIVHAQLHRRIPALARRQFGRRRHGDLRDRAARQVDGVWGSGRDGVEFIVDDDEGLEGVDLDEREGWHVG